MTHCYFRRLGLALLLGLAGSFSARATHILGGQISYRHLGGNQYRVRVERYVDPTSSASTNLQTILVCKGAGCTSAGAGSFTVPLQATAATTPAPSPCGAGAPYQVQVAETDVTLPADRWTLSIDEENRSFSSNNLVQPDQRDMHVQTTLDNTVTLADHSPRFTEAELPYATAHALNRYSFAAFDADGDSLAYSLVPAQWSPRANPSVYECPVAMLYLSYPAGTVTDAGSGQTGSYPAGQFSGAFPLPSFRVSGGVATPWVELNPATGLLLAAPTQLGLYAVAARVDSYRRVGGQLIHLGSATREVTYFVRATPNANPTLTARQGSVAVSLDGAISVLPGQTLDLTFAATDPDAGQTVLLTSNVANLLPGATFQPNLVTPTAQFGWTVPPAAAGRQYAFSVRATDNSCPLKGSDNRTVLLRVAGLRPTAAAAVRNLRVLSAYPTPFNQQVSFQLTGQQPQPVLITDGLGRLVARLQSAADGSVSWRPDALPAGLYFARTLDGAQVLRLVKAH
ncbi:hypothetical protein GCM10027048_30050 [Hymenobacter coalescens]